ncbi:uncharacterized protein Dwil_GK25515 [Drosophila willistoni]|uniref:glutathione-specific gamma-glutamylcyclotransferase n=1 Tax=Drosophila willistoni TaxID=7260 RepID=B4NDU6_DROWI|nr:putative glutathione-specific gamma-glutamylcyclotransferase 2 [Drosophila willistoni]EDW81915.1 uncharacterized protein Dwil_GK25515 [Drosophila willistoni]
MLRHIQSLSLKTDGQLPVVSQEIYRQFFKDLATKPQLLSGSQSSDLNSNSFDVEVTNQAESIVPTPNDVWIFGYGSLVWKADFPYIDRRRGYICGFKRRFYQHSIDHRGVPERPGRVVTLLPGDVTQDRVYGVAYRIASLQKGQVLDHLDYREKNGYERCHLEFHEYPATSEPIQVIMYVATQANDSYAGDVWEVPCIAKQIFSAAGPSGPNREYLFNLALAMAQLFPGAVDEHLTELVECVKHLIERDEPQMLERGLTREIMNILKDCWKNEEALVKRLEALRQRCEQPGWREWLLVQELERQSG